MRLCLILTNRQTTTLIGPVTNGILLRAVTLAITLTNTLVSGLSWKFSKLVADLGAGRSDRPLGDVEHDGCQAQGKGVAGNMRLVAELAATDARTGAKRVCHEVCPVWA